jgi:uncharacterized protein (DUF1697 family)
VALVVFLRGVNVGGHRTFRPSALAAELKHLHAVNIGAAGTFVIRRPIGIAQLRMEFARRLPFETSVMICQGRELVRLTSRDWFAGYSARPDIVRFVSVLAHAPRSKVALPMNLPATGQWLVRILACDSRFVVGLYRRQMKAISCLGTMDRVIGVPMTVRNWNTMTAIAEVLRAGRTPPRPRRIG